MYPKSAMLFERIYKYNKILHNLINTISAIIMFLMTFCVIIQVFYRYILNSPLSWSDEVSRFLMIYLSFLLMPVIYMNDKHITLSIVANALKNSKKEIILKLFIDTIALIFAIMMAYFSYFFAKSGHYLRADVLPIKMDVIYYIVPLGFILMIPSAIIKIVKNWNKLINHNN